MTFALALLLASLDGGRHGDAFALHGVGVPVWEQYRRYQGAGFPVVSLQADGGALQFSNVRQGCNEDGGGCVFAAPGVFISRVPGIASPSFSPVWFSNVEPTDRAFDVRFALLEAAADGGLQAFVRQAGADNGAEMDPYFPPGVDGLVLHVTKKPLVSVVAIVAIVAAIFGFGGIAAGASQIAQVLFFLFLVLFVVSLVMSLARRGSARGL